MNLVSTPRRPARALRPLAAFLLLAGALASPALAQGDTVTLKDGKSETGRIKAEEYAGIQFAPSKGAERMVAWKDVQPGGIVYGGSPEFTSAKESFDANRADEALPKLEELAANDKLREPLRQNALYYLAAIHLRKGDWDKAIESYKALAKEFPKGRYLFEIGEGLVQAHVAKDKGYAAASKALDELSSAALTAGVEPGFSASINVLKGRLFEEQQKWSEAIGAYANAAKATGASAVAVQQARLGEARALAATGKPVEAEALYRKVVAEDAPNAVMAGAWNGLGDLLLKQGRDKRDVAALTDALYAYLRGVVQYGPLPGESTHEYERALAGAALSFKNISDLEQGDKKKVYAEYFRARREQLAREFPNSPWLKGV